MYIRTTGSLGGWVRLSTWKMLAVGASAAVVAAACGSSTRQGSNSAGSGTKTIFIGVEGTLSGSAPIPAFTDGAVAYLKQANAAHTVPGYTFSWKVEDTANNGPQTLAVSRDLVQADHADALITFGSIPIDALKPAAANLKVPIIASGDGDFFQPPQPSMFGATPSYLAMWHYTLQLAKQHFNQSTVGIVYQNDSFGQPLDSAAKQFASSSGVRVSTSVPVPDTTTSDFTPYAARLKSANAPLVIAALAPSLLAGIISTASSLGYHPIWLTNWGAEVPSVVSAIGSAIKQTYAVDFLPPIATTTTAAMKAYKAGIGSYNAGDTSNEFAEQGWDEAAVLITAIQKVVSSKQAVTPSSIQAAMSSIHDATIGTMTGFTYSSTQHFGVTSMALLAYSGGQFHEITPFAPLPAA